jgi:Flp pilus assembly protein TadD
LLGVNRWHRQQKGDDQRSEIFHRAKIMNRPWFGKDSIKFWLFGRQNSKPIGFKSTVGGLWAIFGFAQIGNWQKMNEPRIKSRKSRNVIFVLVCVLVTGILVWSAEPGPLEFESLDPDDAYYNLLVQGFRAGQLNVNRDPAAGLAQLPNPYDPHDNKPYVRASGHLSYDMSYFKGKLYLYFGITPALLLFWPYVTATGHYLSHRNACVIFFLLGFIAAVGVIFRIGQRYFPESGPWVAASGAMALGLAGGVLELVSSCDVYEVAILGGFAFTMIALAAFWRVLHEKERKFQWLALASLAYGLAIASRPSLLFGAIIMLIPAAAARCRESGPGSWRQAGLLFAAAVVPLILIGSGLALYNFLRFGSPFEFGWHYALTDFDDSSARQFSPQYLWFNFHFYFLEPMHWTIHFPFLQAAGEAPLPAGYAGIGALYSGILTHYPVTLLALAAPLAWKGRAAEEIAILRWFATGLFLLFLTSAATLCLLVTASSRYDVDFLPVLLMLAMVGIFGLERALAPSPVRRAIARCLWGLLLAYSLVFNFLATIDAHTAIRFFVGNYFFHNGSLDKAIENFNRASTLEPHAAGFHLALANALSQAGRRDESIVQFQKALEIQPDSPEADNNLAFTLLQAGRLDDAIKFFQKALALQKTYQSYYNLAFALRMNKMALEAETNLQKAIELEPQFMPAQMDLSWILATWPDAPARNGARALAIAGNLNRQHPDDSKILRIYAAACAETGHFPEAIATAKRARALAQTQSQMTLVDKLQAETMLYQNNNPCRSFGN